MNKDSLGVSRRDFVKIGAIAGVATATTPLVYAQAKTPGKIRVGFVGVGGMGTNHIRILSRIPDAVVTAVCDIRPEHAKRAADIIKNAGYPEPKLYTKGEHDFERLCASDDIDLVYTATPWRWHVPVCLSAMNNGKHAATEVPAAITIEDCWKLVDTSEKTGKHCIMQENCCYDRIEMKILNMVRQGLLGEILHAECGYLHDLRRTKLSDHGEGLWRREHSIKRNGDLYPTHGLGPIAQCMNINRGNRFVRLVSMASQSRGLKLYAAEKYGPDSEKARQDYALGDVVTTMIKTNTGATIVVTHDTNNPHPYSRNIIVQGTKGIVRKYPKAKLYIEGLTKGEHWHDASEYIANYNHPLWKRLDSQRASTGTSHGGMDFIEDARLIECLRNGTRPDADVYDAAAWSAVSALSEKSIAGGSIPVNFPDFTRGKWKTNKPLGIVS
jgi:predicted dehydrogenase